MFTESLCCRIWWTRSFSAYVLPWSQICLLYSQLLWLLSRQTESSLKERPFSHCKRHYLPYFVERHYGGRTPTHHKERWPRRWRGTERSWPAQQTTKAELLPEASDQGFCMTSTIGPAWLYSTNRSGDQATYADSGRGSISGPSLFQLYTSALSFQYSTAHCIFQHQHWPKAFTLAIVFVFFLINQNKPCQNSLVFS